MKNVMYTIEMNSVKQISAVAQRIIIELLHSKRTLFFWMLFPTLMLLLFGLIYGNNLGNEKSFDTTAPGILIGAAFFFSCLSGPITVIVAEQERNTLKRLLLSPLSGTAYFLGIFLAYTTIALGQTIIVYGLSYLFGGRYHGSILLGLLIILLSVASYVGLGFFFGARFARRTEDVTGPLAAIGVPLLVLAGVFFPLKLLPPYLLKIAYFNPIFHMREALTAVSANDANWQEVSDHVLILGIFSIVSLVGGIYSYRKMVQDEKQK